MMLRNDFKETLLVMCKNNTVEYEALKKISADEFLLRYKLFIDDLNNKNG